MTKVHTACVIGALALLPLSRVYAQGLGNCEDGWVEKDESPAFQFIGNPGKVIIKAGSQNQGQACFEFTQDSTDGCYSVSGFGTGNVTVIKIGDGPDCKDISHTEWFGGDIIVTPSPSPSASASASPSPSPSIDPSPAPSPSPLSTPLSTPSSPTPSMEVQMQQVMEEVKREDPQLIGKVSFK